jgi:hypothetical protein
MSWYPDLPHVQAASYGGVRSSTQMIVIHCTANTAPATNEAAYAQKRPDEVSAHFYADGTRVIQAVDTSLVAYGCYPTGNSRSVQFELTGLVNQVSDATMRRVAPIVARACAEFGIPVRKVPLEQLRAGTKGICGHADVTRAWGEGDHLDPGDLFPWAAFIDYVQEATVANPTENERMAFNADAWGAGAVQMRDVVSVQLRQPDGSVRLADTPNKLKTTLIDIQKAIMALDDKIDALASDVAGHTQS